MSFDAGVNILVKWLLVAFPGVGGLLAAYAHTARAEKTAAYIGWQPGSPFQFEVAMANLALGVAGVMCLWMGHGFQAGVGVVFSIFVLGAARGHLDQRKKKRQQVAGQLGHLPVAQRHHRAGGHPGAPGHSGHLRRLGRDCPP